MGQKKVQTYRDLITSNGVRNWTRFKLLPVDTGDIHLMTFLENSAYVFTKNRSRLLAIVLMSYYPCSAASSAIGTNAFGCM